MSCSFLIYNTNSQDGNNGNIYQWTPPSGESVQSSVYGNRYYATSTAAGFDETTLTLTGGSVAKNAGISGHLISTLDYHQLAFNQSTPSIGAVQ
jgi:hypothetical protein